MDSHIERIERGINILINVRHEFPFETFLKKHAGLHSVFDKMTQTILNHTPTHDDLFQHHEPKPLIEIDLKEAPKKKIEDANIKLGLALDEGEIEYLVEAFSHKNGRKPTDVELFMFAQVNSEHCRHKIFNADWTIDGEKKPFSLFKMIKNTHNLHPEYTISAYSDNAAVLEGHDAVFYAPVLKTKVWTSKEEKVQLICKVETHNHPTAVSPFAGAATGSGGEIRDEGAVGRGSKSKAGLSGFSISDLLIPGSVQPWELDIGKPSHIASALDIIIEAPIGSAAFNNEFGRPCITGYFRTLTTRVVNGNGKEEIRGFHKPIMIAGGLGAIRPQFALKNKKITDGACIIVLGGPSMLIGLGGGAASSVASGDASSDLDFASVQRGNPEMQRRAQQVIDACIGLDDNNPIQSIHDVGAGGLSNALPELVHDNGLGAIFELRDVPCVEPGMSPMEIWCCEAQERYVLAVAPSDLQLFKEICDRERAHFAVVGHATTEERLILNDKLLGTTPIDLEMSILFGKPPKMSRTAITKPLTLTPFNSSVHISEAVDRVLHLPSVGSKSFLISIGDRSVTGLIDRDQMVGPWQVPVADVGVTSTALGQNIITGEALAMGEKPGIALISPAASAKMCVAESLMNLYASDVSALERVRMSANWMSAASHEGEGSALYEAVQAIGLDLCPALGVSIPVGKDSMSLKMKWNEDGKKKEVTAPLSLVITAFSPVDNTHNTWTPQLQNIDESTKLVFVDLSDISKPSALGGSAIAQVYNELGDAAPSVFNTGIFKGFLKALEELHKSENPIVLAYHDRSDGGIFVTLLEMAFSGRTGLDISLKGNDDVITALFNEELGAVFQIRDSDLARFGELLNTHGVPEGHISVVGSTNNTKNQEISFSYNGVQKFTSTRAKLQQAWSETSYKIQRLRDNPQCADQEFANITDNQDPGLSYKLSFETNDLIGLSSLANKRPQVAILREQGVNGQQEMAFSFEQAGFTSVDVHMTDILSGSVNLDDFVGIAACGGFSYGDVLGAGAGWAKSILFHKDAKAQFERFFNQRKDTFAFGACNGCQMISGLKSLINGAEDWPTFSSNASEQYEARVAMVEILDNGPEPSVFLHGMKGSKLPIAVAHGEGRASFSTIEQQNKLQSNGLVSVRYVDNYGNATEKYPFNPNGSVDGITGVRTPNGRVLIMMPHPERVTRKESNSWYPADAAWGENGPWVRLFRSARRWVN